MNQIAEQKDTQTGLMARFAQKYHVEPGKMNNTLKATAFRQSDGREVTNEQMMALVVVAHEHNLNPFTKEIYAFPDKNGGIVPIVGVDGWSRIINQHPQFDGMDFEQDEESCTCIIYRKDRQHPIRVTEWMSECARGTGPWKSHPRRMLRHKAMIQCARIAFSFTGIYDQDEAERIVEGQVVDYGHRGEPEPQAAPASPDEIQSLREELAGMEMPEDVFSQAMGISGLDSLTADGVQDAWAEIKFQKELL